VTPPVVSDYSSFVLGQTRETTLVETSGGNRNALGAMIPQTRRTLDVFARELDPMVMDHPEVLDPIRELIARGARPRIRVLARDVNRAVANGHRLIPLFQRFSTFISIRELGREHRTFNTGLYIADQTGLLVRRHSDRFEGEVCFADLVSAREHTRVFEEMWAGGVENSNLRSLHI